MKVSSGKSGEAWDDASAREYETNGGSKRFSDGIGCWYHRLPLTLQGTLVPSDRNGTFNDRPLAGLAEAVGIWELEGGEVAPEVAARLAPADGEVDSGTRHRVHHECAGWAIESKSGDRDHGVRGFDRLSECTTSSL